MTIPKTKIGRLKSKVLSKIGLLFSSNLKDPSRIKYPQLWYCMPDSKTIRSNLLQCLCGLTEHEPSDIEWGYAGGEYADRWCRWCNKLLRVPKTSIHFINKSSRDYMKLLDK